MGDVVQLPRGGLDERAYADHRFVLRGTLPAVRSKGGRVTWAGGGTLTRPLEGAEQAYKAWPAAGMESRTSR